jgi:hypothetical protein
LGDIKTMPLPYFTNVGYYRPPEQYYPYCPRCHSDNFLKENGVLKPVGKTIIYDGDRPIERDKFRCLDCSWEGRRDDIDTMTKSRHTKLYGKHNFNLIKGRRISEIDPYGEENWEE